MNTRRLTSLLLAAIFAIIVASSWAVPTESADKKLEECRKGIRAIDRMKLSKEVVTREGLLDRNIAVNLTTDNYKDVYETASLIYKDQDDRIRKFVEMFNYPESVGYSLHYFDVNRCLMGSTFLNNLP